VTPSVADIRRVPRPHRSIPLLPLLTAVLVVAGIWVVIIVLRPLPPRTVTMATGPEGGAYADVGRRYRDILAQHGITLFLIPTAGAVENLARLRDPRSEVDVALLQGGITTEQESPGLQSLGTVFYEPLWFFHRGSAGDKGLEALRGRKVSIGPEGSGTRILALELLARHGMDARSAELLPLSFQDAADRLVRGQIDAALVLAAWESPVVRQLLAEDTIELVSFPRADAHVALFPFLTKLRLPAGVRDLARNRPPRDVILVAPKASLVVRKDLHPAIQSLLLDAAEQIHSGPGIFQQARQFPAPEAIGLPLSDEARQFYRSGRPFLQRNLPFWLAVAIGRLLVLLIPLVGVMYPLFWLMPAVYGWGIRHRIFRMYRELRELDQASHSGRALADVNAALGELEQKASHLRVPLSYSDLLYTLRVHIALVREHIAKTEGTPPA
jgi:TRAP transporter TAXI family solute receptor